MYLLQKAVKPQSTALIIQSMQTPFLCDQCSSCHENTDSVWEAYLLCLWSKHLEPDSASH